MKVSSVGAVSNWLLEVSEGTPGKQAEAKKRISPAQINLAMVNNPPKMEKVYTCTEIAKKLAYLI